MEKKGKEKTNLKYNWHHPLSGFDFLACHGDYKQHISNTSHSTQGVTRVAKGVWAMTV